jgi:hypothetical protein
MPNHVTNNIVFECPEEYTEKILEFLRVEGKELGTVDFNKLIPMPESLKIDSGSSGARGYDVYVRYLSETEYMTDENEKNSVRDQLLKENKIDLSSFNLGKQYYENKQKYGCFTWYEWSYDNWGTKWNAYDCVPVNPSDGFIEFYTAWNPVPLLVKKISEKFPEAVIKYSYADEDIGYNVGRYEFKNGEVINEDIPYGGSKRALLMAAEIQGLSIEELKEYYGYKESEKAVSDKGER